MQETAKFFYKKFLWKNKTYQKKASSVIFDWSPPCTVKKAVELLDAPSKNTFLKSNKYNSIVEIVYLDTLCFFPHSVIEWESSTSERYNNSIPIPK